MCKILISINPEHVINIFNGSKKYEYRKIRCKENVDKLIIYCTNPVKKIVGEANVEAILVDSLQTIWEQTKNETGINLEFFNEYYKGKNKAIAYKLDNIKKYDKPLDLSYMGVKNAPQSFIYV